MTQASYLILSYYSDGSEMPKVEICHNDVDAIAAILSLASYEECRVFGAHWSEATSLRLVEISPASIPNPKED